MKGLFPDREEVRVKVQSDFSDELDLEIGMVVILKKKIVPEQSSLIIHRITGKFLLNGKVYVWEKGDNDYFPKLCDSENIIGIVIGICDRPGIESLLDPHIWQKQNRTLLRFYARAGRIYAFIEERKINQILKKIFLKGFFTLLYCICSLLSLKGTHGKH
ncbi:MAG: hypothetical protein ACMUIP_03500 [bacterium]